VAIDPGNRLQPQGAGIGNSATTGNPTLHFLFIKLRQRSSDTGTSAELQFNELKTTN